MSFSLAHVALMRTATQLASGVAGRVSEAIGFDDILRGTAGEATGGDASQGESDIGELVGRLAEKIRSVLAGHSIDSNLTLSLRVQENGSLRLEGAHPKQAELEALLNFSSDTIRLASELSRATGSKEISIDLTSPGKAANMIGPGGYPNW